MRNLFLAGICLLALAETASAAVYYPYGGSGGGVGTPGGTNGQIQYNNAGSFGGFTPSGDCTITTSAVTCTKTNGAAFAPSATTDTTNASNITSGTLSSSRFSSVAASGDVSIGTTGIVTVTGVQGTSVSAPTGTGAVVLQASPTITGTLTLGTTAAVVASTPSVSSGFGSSPSVSAGSTTAAFRVNVGTGGSATTGVLALGTAATGWNCVAQDITTPASFIVGQTASTTSTASLASYSRTTGLSTAWTASDILAVQCWAY
jgi:hypothetical protein